MSESLRFTTVLTRRGRSPHRAQWLLYLPDDPAAVRLVIDPTRSAPPPRPVPGEDDTTRSAQAQWCVARGVLHDALTSTHPAARGGWYGAGAVLLCRNPGRTRELHVALYTADGWWEAITDTHLAAEFLASSYELVSCAVEEELLTEAAKRLDPEKLTEREELA